LTTEQETDKYAATMETANATIENALFYNVSATATTVPAGFTNDPNNKMASKLNGNINTGGNKRVGPSIILKVMTGDTISISTNSWYTGAVQPAATGVTSISNDLLPLLTAGIGGAGGGKGGAVPTSFSGPFLGPDIANMISTDSSTYSTLRPKAFLNWMVVGEDYVAATGSSNHVAAVQIPICNSGDTMKTIVGLNKLVVRRNGWIYIYVSNESNQDVYFDNLVINLTHGPLVEQNDYYSFGMQNPALSTKALKQNYFENRRKFNAKSELQSKEFSDSSGLELYCTNYRMYDPQLGRFNQIDPLADVSEYESAYVFASNSPISRNDPFGLKDSVVNGENVIVSDQYAAVTVTPKKKKDNSALLPLLEAKKGTDGVNLGLRPINVRPIRFLSAEEANTNYPKPPYLRNSRVAEFRTEGRLKGYVRVSSSKLGNRIGSFFVRAKDIQGMTPEQIQQNLALPEAPDQIGAMDPPPGTLVRAGPVGENDFGPGNPDITQFELMEMVPESSFLPSTPIMPPTSTPMESPFESTDPTGPIEPVDPIEPEIFP
jgi:RHS repeat-associated protein